MTVDAFIAIHRPRSPRAYFINLSGAMVRVTVFLLTAQLCSAQNWRSQVTNIFREQDPEPIKVAQGLANDAPFGSAGLCVIGCTPYVDSSKQNVGMEKYQKLVEEMAETCDVLVHVGDTKPGAMPCNENVMTHSVHMMREAAASHGKMALYVPGDNELNDCHRHGSKVDPAPADIYKAADARSFLVNDLRLHELTDLTNAFPVENHDMSHSNIPGTDRPYSCDFDKYVELSTYALATLEVIGSHYYLDDERKSGYPNQDEVDPLEDRLYMYLNANDCALDWIEESATKAHANGKKALFFLFHATFYHKNGIEPAGSGSIGDYYSKRNLIEMTQNLTGSEISRPYEPLFNKLTEVAFRYPEMMFYVVHSDAHRWLSIRMNPGKHNRPNKKFSHHNLMIHQVEGASRSLTMYSRFTVDDQSFQPVTLKQEWSQTAFDTEPIGHTWVPF